MYWKNRLNEVHHRKDIQNSITIIKNWRAFISNQHLPWKSNQQHLILKDQTSDLLTWKGNLCVLIDLGGMCLEVDKAITFMASLPITDKKSTKLNFLPYDTSLTEEAESNLTTDNMNNFTCKQCGVLVNSKQMRKHVGLRNSCGFCGLVGCTIDLVTGSGSGVILLNKLFKVTNVDKPTYIRLLFC